MLRKKRYYGARYLVSAVAVVIMAALCAASATGASASRLGKSRTAAGVSSGATFQEGGPQSALDSQVNTLGESSYSDVFTGTYLEPGGLLDIYVAAGQDDSAFLAAVAAVNSGNLPFNVVQVPHSYAYLDGWTSNLAAAEAGLATQGVQLSGWGPEPASGTVEVSFAPPTPQALKTLAATARSMNITTPVTSADYASVSGQVLQIEFPGADLTIQSATEPIAQSFTENRNNDSSPWNGGDQIWGYNGYRCASGFGIVNTTTGNYSLITAGHCGITGWYSTQAKTTRIGGVTNQYWENANFDDFELIATNVSGKVYTGPPGSSSQANINDTGDPGVGDLVTFDGPSIGEVTGQTVLAKDVCQIFMDPTGTNYYTVCHLDKFDNSLPVAVSGDSGGPVIQRESGSSDVAAVATIVGGMVGPGAYVWCEKISNELTRAGAAIVGG